MTTLVIITSFMGDYVKNRDSFNLRLAEKVIPVLNRMGFSKVVIRDAYPGAEFRTPSYRITFDEMKHAPKGICVQKCLEYAKRMDSPDYVIFIDGSYKIDPEYVPDIANYLLNKGLDAVLAQRGTNKAITENRWNIEMFEMFLLEQKYNRKEFPDGQCGLWGFRVFNTAEKRIEITSEDYGVEWNLVSQILKKGYNFDFVPIEVRNPDNSVGFVKEASGTTGFNELENSMRKMDFMRVEESLTNEMIDGCITEFCKTKSSLPKWYVDEIKKRYPPN